LTLDVGKEFVIHTVWYVIERISYEWKITTIPYFTIP
jgi:hypothetical protein